MNEEFRKNESSQRINQQRLQAPTLFPCTQSRMMNDETFFHELLNKYRRSYMDIGIAR